MAIFECPFCGKRIVNAMICRECKGKYDISEPWAQDLLRMETKWRSLLKRDQRAKVLTFSEYSLFHGGDVFDGWDILDGEIGQGKTSEPFVNAMGQEEDFYEIPDYERLSMLELEHLLFELAEEADLTEGELRAFQVYLCNSPDKKPISANLAAEILSEFEGKVVSPEAFRRRLSDARRKLKVATPSIPNLAQRIDETRLRMLAGDFEIYDE
jgi:hypothetical protein